MIISTYNIELNMNNDSLNHWIAFLTQVKDAYNMCSEYIIDNNIKLDIKSVHNETYDLLRTNFDMLPAQSVIKIYKDVLAAVRSIKSNKHKNAETPNKSNLSIRIDKRLYSKLTVDGIYLTGEVKNKRTFYPFIKYPKMEEMFKLYKPQDPLIFIRDNRIFLSVPFEMPEPPITSDNSIGVDLGMKRLFVTSDGYAFRDTNYLKTRREIRHLKKQLKSKNTKSSKRHLKKLKRREANLSKDMCNRAANALLSTTDASIIVMEDLSKIKQNTSKTKEGYKRKRHNNAISQVPFYKFKEILAHKAALSGRKVQTVSPSYTSQTDSRTGKKNGIRKGCRYYCKDGVMLDADWNAAINIAKRGKHPLSETTPIDGGLCFLNGRALSTAQSWECSNTTCKPLCL